MISIYHKRKKQLPEPDHPLQNHRLWAVCTAFLHRNILLLSGILFLGFYWLLFVPESSGYEEVIVENGAAEFTASFASVTAIVPANQDPQWAELLDEEPIAIQITILDPKGNAAGTVTMQDCRIHTDGFITTENLTQSGVPLTLTVGETYHLEYEAYCGEVDLTELSFSICGNKVWLTAENIAVIGILLVLLVGVILVRSCAQEEGGCSYRRETAGWILIFLSLAVLILLSVPMMNEDESERTAFADAYAVSNIILGQEVSDADGYVYIAESGIRNMGYLSYSVPLHRFWTNWNYGNMTGERFVCTLYRVSGNHPSVVTLLDGAAIALARLAKMPYQIVYLSGKLLNLILGFLMFLIVLRLLRSMRPRGKETAGTRGSIRPMAAMVILIFLLPSMMQGLLSYRSGGLAAAVCLLVGTLLWRLHRERMGCWAVILLGACGILISMVQIVLSDGSVPSVVLHTILAQSEDWLRGLVCSISFISDRMTLACLGLAGVLIVLWAVMQGSLSDRNTRSLSVDSGGSAWSAAGFAAWVIGTMAVILSGGIGLSEAGYLILADVQPVLFLPLALIPLIRTNSRESMTENSSGPGISSSGAAASAARTPKKILAGEFSDGVRSSAAPAEDTVMKDVHQHIFQTFSPAEGESRREDFCRCMAEAVLVLIAWIGCSCLL